MRSRGECLVYPSGADGVQGVLEGNKDSRAMGKCLKYGQQGSIGPMWNHVTVR